MKDSGSKQVVCRLGENIVDGSGVNEATLTREEARELQLRIAEARSWQFGLPELDSGLARVRESALLARDRLYATYEVWQTSGWRGKLSDRQWSLVERLVGRIFQMEARWYMERSGATLLELFSEQLWYELREQKQRKQALRAPAADTPAPPSGEELMQAADEDLSADAC